MPDQDNYSLLRSHSGRLTAAASFVNEHYLGAPFGSTPIHGRLLNQRFLIELTNKHGHKIYTENCDFLDADGKSITKEGKEFKYGNLIYKISMMEPVSDPLLNSISYEEAYYAIYHLNKRPSGYKSAKEQQHWENKREAFLKACDQGLIKVEPNFEALKTAGYTVNHVIHRPNHGLHHSMRAAASIPMIMGFFDKTASASEVEKLQHMMLFSVVGRLDETGFSETGDWGKGKTTYQGFRTTSGLAYLDYCENKEGVYTDLEKKQYAHYRDGLVVELMGFDDINQALKVHSCDGLNQTWLKDRILKDSNRLVEMGTLTAEEAKTLDEAVDKQLVADELLSIVQKSVPKRYILESAIPGVLVRFIEKNYPNLYQGKLTEEEKEEKLKIDNAPEGEKAAVIKQILPKILADPARRVAFFPFITPLSTQTMSEQLWNMNWAHGLDLSRCYSLEAQFYTRLIEMPTDVNTTLPDWEKKLTETLKKDDLEKVEKQKGFLVIKTNDNLFYIRHTDDQGNMHYSKIDGQNDPDLIQQLIKHKPPKDTRLKHSQLLFHMAEKKGYPTGASQYFGNIHSLVNTCFYKSTDLLTFKNEMIKLYSFLNGIQEMHLRTGERMNFQLHSKADFQSFLELPETNELYELCKNDPGSFAAKFTSKAISKLYNDISENYNYAKAFRIFSETPNVTHNRDYLAEAVNCARLIDSGPKPTYALKTDEIPEIQSLRYNPDNKEMALTFADSKTKEQFQKIYQELIKSPKGILSGDGLSITIPLAHYKYLHDNRYLKFKLETVPEKHSVEEELIDPDTGEYSAIRLIQQQRAVVRLHNTFENDTGQRPYETELEAMEQPMYNRRVAIPTRLKRLLEQPEEEKTYINERRIVTHPITGVERTRKVHLESAPPEPQYQQPQIPELDHPDLASEALFQEQGGVKNTHFLTKAPYTLLNPTGTTQLFMGALTSRSKYFPIGTLSDIEKTHKGGGKYIWTGRANSWEKLWLGKKENKVSQLPQGVTLDELKKLQREGDDPNEHNELLLRSSKEAIRGLVAPKNTLIDRLNLAAQSLNIKQDFGISVPLIILDPGDPSCPKPYTEDMIRKDVQESVRLLREQRFEYDTSLIPDLDANDKAIRSPRDLEAQNKIITQLLNECGFPVRSNPAQNISPKNRLKLPPETPEDNDLQKIERFLQKLSLPGGEFAQMQQITDKASFNALAPEKKDTFFIKQVALGNIRVINQLFSSCGYRPNEELSKQAHKIASERHGIEWANAITDALGLVGAAIEPAINPIQQPPPSERRSKNDSNLDAAIKKFEKYQKELGPLAFQSDLLSKAEAAMIKIHPNFSKKIKKNYYNLSSGLGYQVLEILRQMDKAEASLKLSIKKAEKENPKTDSLVKSLEKAHGLVNNPEGIKEDAMRLLDGPSKSSLQREIQTKIQKTFKKENVFQEEMVNDIFRIVSESRDPTQGLPIQMRLALLRWQSNPTTADWPMDEACKTYLSNMASEWLLRETRKIKVNSIIDTIWKGDLRELVRLDPVLETFFSKESNKKMAEAISELQALQPENLKTNDDILSCKDTLLNKARVVFDNGTPAFKNNSPKQGELNKTFTETKVRIEDQFQTLEKKLMSIQAIEIDFSNCQSTAEVTEKISQLKEVIEEVRTVPKLTFAHELLESTIKEKTASVVVEAEKQKERINTEPRLFKELTDLQPEMITQESEINKTKLALLNKSKEIKEIYNKGLAESPKLKQAFEATQVRIETQFKILEAKLKSIHEATIDFSMCITIKEVEEKQKITIEGLKAVVPPAFAEPMFQEVIETKIKDLNEAAEMQTRVLVTKLFKTKHTELYKKDIQSFSLFRSTAITEATSLEDSVKHAKESNRTQKAFIELGWMNKDGSLTQQAPALITKIFNEQSKNNTSYFKKAIDALQGKKEPKNVPPGSKIP